MVSLGCCMVLSSKERRRFRAGAVSQSDAGSYPASIERRFRRSRIRGLATLNEGWAKVGSPRASNQRQRRVDLLAQDAEHIGGPFFTTRCKSVERRTSEQHRTGAERQGFDHVGATPKATIDQNGAVDPCSKLGELLNGSCDVLQLASTVIRDDHPVDAQLKATLSILGAQQALHQKGVGPSIPERLQVIPR